MESLPSAGAAFVPQDEYAAAVGVSVGDLTRLIAAHALPCMVSADSLPAAIAAVARRLEPVQHILPEAVDFVEQLQALGFVVVHVARPDSAVAASEGEWRYLRLLDAHGGLVDDDAIVEAVCELIGGEPLSAIAASQAAAHHPPAAAAAAEPTPLAGV